MGLKLSFLKTIQGLYCPTTPASSLRHIPMDSGQWEQCNGRDAKFASQNKQHVKHTRQEITLMRDLTG